MRIKNIKINEEKKVTWNITVQDNHNYYVEGVLVKNSEKPLVNLGACNLLSLVMSMFSSNPQTYKKQLQYIVPLLVRFSDNVTTYEIKNGLSPLTEQSWIIDQLREIGMGITDLHGWLLKQDLSYASKEANNSVVDFFESYALEVFKASIELGKEKGNAPAWDLIQDKEIFMGSSFFSNIVNKYFDGKAHNIKALRTMAFMSIAPSGSISNTIPVAVLGSGAEPLIAPWYWRKTRAINKGTYTHYFVIPQKVQEYLVTKITDANDLEKIKNFPGSVLDEDGVIGKGLVNIIYKYIHKDLFTPAHMIDPLGKIDMMSGIYKWMDSSISITYNLPDTSTPQDVYDIYMAAYEKGVRAVSVYVDGSREGVLIFEDPITNAKKFKEKNNADTLCSPEKRPATITLTCAPKRPIEIPCDIYSISIKGVQWKVLVGLLHEQPFEIFCGQSEDLYLPQTCKNGIIRKQGEGKYELEVVIRKSPVVFKDLAGVLMTDNERSLTRLLSLNLRHGVPPQYIVQQLKKTNGDITSFSTAISRVLSKYVGVYALKESENICPECKEPSLVVTGGCIECVTPGCFYTRCGS